MILNKRCEQAGSNSPQWASLQRRGESTLSKMKVNDYIKEYDENEGAKLYEHEIQKSKQSWYEQMFHMVQNPLLLFLMMFIFQMHIIKRILIFSIGRFTGKLVFREDGTMTVLGMILKSMVFTGIYFFLNFLLAIV